MVNHGPQHIRLGGGSTMRTQLGCVLIWRRCGGGGAVRRHCAPNIQNQMDGLEKFDGVFARLPARTHDNLLNEMFKSEASLALGQRLGERVSGKNAWMAVPNAARRPKLEKQKRPNTTPASFATTLKFFFTAPLPSTGTSLHDPKFSACHQFWLHHGPGICLSQTHLIHQ
jgi:hypothetical protein